jgi:GntR family transcriptional regulator
MKKKAIYMEIADSIQNDLKKNFKPGDKLEPESQYEIKYGVSRVTIRRALEYLADSKVIYYTKNKGYFVLDPTINRGSEILSFTEYNAKENIKVTNKVLKIEKTVPEEKIRKILGLNDGEEVYLINRIRYGNEIPRVIEYAYISAKSCPGLEKFNFELYSLYDIIREYYNLEIIRQVYTFNAKMIKGFEAETLLEEKTGPALIITTTGYASPGMIPIEYCIQVNNYKSFDYVITLDKTGN